MANMNNNAPAVHLQPPTTGGNRKLKSDVWKLFDYLPPSTAGGKDGKAICKTCGKTLSAYSRNGTAHLSRHIGSTSCMNVIAQLHDDLGAQGLVHI